VNIGGEEEEVNVGGGGVPKYDGGGVWTLEGAGGEVEKLEDRVWKSASEPTNNALPRAMPSLRV
jgi:hypothetical protein